MTPNCDKFSPAQMMRCYLDALFKPSELIEIRPIEVWSDESGRRRSRVLRRNWRWFTRSELMATQDCLTQLNHHYHANIFVGVNPRTVAGMSTKAGVSVVRSLWLDLDRTTASESLRRFEECQLPPPSIVVNSGNGVHAYWLLDQEVAVSSARSRAIFESTLQCLAQRIGGDATQDVSRLLRLPGFLNCKNARNGDAATPCELVRCEAGWRYPMSMFVDRWSRSRPENAGRKKGEPNRSVPGSIEVPSGLCRIQAMAVASVVSRLDDRVSDRSRRDFAVLLELVGMGLTEHQIWLAVCSRSKFATDGWEYFQRTLQNARATAR